MADIIVVGSGAAGAAVFGELLRHEHAATVHWIVDRPEPGRGVAYDTRDDLHLLNVRASGMGLFHDHADDFLQHASRELGQIEGTDFLPRRLFGDFVQAQIRAQIQKAQAMGRPFEIHHAEATRIAAGLDGGYALHLSDGRCIHADAVVLALGALPPRPLKAVSDSALESGNYCLDPWRLAQRQAAPRRMLVIGTGLTAVDVILSAHQLWPDAQFQALSRHGLLPFVHPARPTAPYAMQGALNEALLDCRGALPMLRRVRAALAGTDVDWRSVIDGMRPVNARLWQGMDDRQRKQFLDHLRWLWESSRHRMAPASAAILRQLRDENRLTISGSRVLKVDGSRTLEVTVRHRATQQVSVLEADLVVQATGLDTAAAYAEHGLVSQLLRDGLAKADPLQLGIAAEPDGRILDAQGAPQAGLFAIGALLRGNLWECTAMPEIRTMAHGMAKALAERHQHSPTALRELDPLGAAEA